MKQQILAFIEENSKENQTNLLSSTTALASELLKTHSIHKINKQVNWDDMISEFESQHKLLDDEHRALNTMLQKFNSFVVLLTMLRDMNDKYSLNMNISEMDILYSPKKKAFVLAPMSMTQENWNTFVGALTSVIMFKLPMTTLELDKDKNTFRVKGCSELSYYSNLTHDGLEKVGTYFPIKDDLYWNENVEKHKHLNTETSLTLSLYDIEYLPLLLAIELAKQDSGKEQPYLCEFLLDLNNQFNLQNIDTIDNDVLNNMKFYLFEKQDELIKQKFGYYNQEIVANQLKYGIQALNELQACFGTIQFANGNTVYGATKFQKENDDAQYVVVKLKSFRSYQHMIVASVNSKGKLNKEKEIDINTFKKEFKLAN